MRLAKTLLTLAATVPPMAACVPVKQAATSVVATAPSGSVQSVIPADRLAQIKAALPRVASPSLQAILQDQNTFWYDHDSMTPSYQETGYGFPENGPAGDGGGGANANVKWGDQVVPTLDGRTEIFDLDAHHWRFPFAGTMGIDDSTNAQTADFLSLPRDQSGNIQAIPVKIELQGTDGTTGGHKSWQWIYPNGTIVGEVIFIKDASGNLFPTEVRTRQRFAAGWATNAFRPFPQAADLSAAIKARRPQWQSNAALSTLVAQLDGGGQLTAKSLHAEGLKGTFDQDGSLDILPDFGDPQLVRDLLTTTVFASAYGKIWRQAGGSTTYAASTSSTFSIVPQNYTAGLVQVNETSCMRCHKETAKLVDAWYPDLYLYGEIWGKDNIFTFHPFDESYYSQLDLDNTDNRHMNQNLQSQGLIKMVDQLPTDGAFTRTTGN